MKKIFSILLLALTLSLFTGCIFVGDVDYEPSKYDITCYNDTMKVITDWCVKKGDNKTYANSDYNCEIKDGKKDTIKDLSYGYYSICISFKNKIKLHPDDYEQTNEILLDEDVEFSVAERTFYGRSATASDLEKQEPEYVVIVNGKEYPLSNK